MEVGCVNVRFRGRGLDLRRAGAGGFGDGRFVEAGGELLWKTARSRRRLTWAAVMSEERVVMRHSPHAALARCLVLLLVVVAGVFVWEHRRLSGDLTVQGSVAGVERVSGGKGGDNRRFTIRYEVEGAVRNTRVSRGLIDHFVRFRDLSRGDAVPLRVDPAAPGDARLDSINATYPLTLCFVALILCLLGAWVAVARRLRSGDRAKA